MFPLVWHIYCWAHVLRCTYRNWNDVEVRCVVEWISCSFDKTSVTFGQTVGNSQINRFDVQYWCNFICQLRTFSYWKNASCRVTRSKHANFFFNRFHLKLNLPKIERFHFICIGKHQTQWTMNNIFNQFLILSTHPMWWPIVLIGLIIIMLFVESLNFIIIIVASTAPLKIIHNSFSKIFLRTHAQTHGTRTDHPNLLKRLIKK